MTQTPSRRRFVATATASGAAALGFPAIVKAQTTSLRFQSTWPAKDIFHEYALDFAKKVGDMAGGEVRIEVLPAGAVASPFGLLQMVSSGQLDASHGTLNHHYGRHPAFAL
ncbi:MAG TPA: C4-dicarboxylate ABC transporter, partial [Burkholderiaceae bacterium]|nr:C4-dicarboxylate ABC transporter [Burkholderiaceae bacterium]